MSEGDEQPKRGLRWDGTITAGNVLTAGTLVLALLIWGLRLESRVDRTEERQVRGEQLAAAYRAEDRASEAMAFGEVRRSLSRIEDYLIGRVPAPSRQTP